MNSHELALHIYRQAIAAVHPDYLITNQVALSGTLLQLGDLQLDLDHFTRVRVVGAGKASAEMALTMEKVLGEKLTDGLVVTKEGHSRPTVRIRILEASHPVLDARSLAAGEAMIAMLADSTQNDLVICLISGGASALLEALLPGIELDDVQTATSILLKSGANIHEINCVRACMSRIKAGGLVRAAGHAKVVCLVISDVMGNHLEIIGSGPCVNVVPDRDAALKILIERGLISQVPSAIIELLKQEPPEVRSANPVHHIILADLSTAANAAKLTAEEFGLITKLLSNDLQGEAREKGVELANLAKMEHAFDWSCIIASGETTVTVTGQGKGGRCQEIALSAAIELSGTDGITMLCGSTDGTDGPTDAAGAMIDGKTASQIRHAGFDPTKSLGENDSYPCLESAGALIFTGPTQTNVGDIVMIIMDGHR